MHMIVYALYLITLNMSNIMIDSLSGGAYAYSNSPIESFNLSEQPQPASQSCSLIGITGLLIQLSLGLLSFSVLLYKRKHEQPRRPWKIFMLDTSKQAVSQLLAHCVNVAISMGLSDRLQSDACLWYFATNVLDNTVGVLMCIALLKAVQSTLFLGPYERFRSGNYYSVSIDSDMDQRTSYQVNTKLAEEQSTNRHTKNRQTIKQEHQAEHKPQQSHTNQCKQTPQKPLALQISKLHQIYMISYLDWFIQFIVWNIIAILTKTFLFYLQLALSDPLIAITQFLFGWIQPYEELQLILVIVIVPVVMNGFAFWMQDNILMRRPKQKTANQQQFSRSIIQPLI